jgi:hypothetical protein
MKYAKKRVGLEGGQKKYKILSFVVPIELFMLWQKTSYGGTKK